MKHTEPIEDISQVLDRHKNMLKGAMRNLIRAAIPIGVVLAGLGYGAITVYYWGYLSYFDIDMRYVDFKPHLTDFLLVAAPYIIVTLAILLFITIVLIAPHILLLYINTIKESLLRKPLHFIARFFVTVPYRALATLIAIAISIGLPIFTLFQFEDMGTSTAADKDIYNAINSPDESKIIKVVVHQQNNTLYIKDFDTSTGEFLEDYQVTDGAGKRYKEIDITQY